MMMRAPHLLKQQRGIALIMVLTAITILTVASIEFAYNTNVAYQLAVSEKNRLQAFYLAKSAYHFMRLELKYDRTFRQIMQQQNLDQVMGAAAQLPLCQQFPLSTALIRAVFVGGGEGGEAAIPDDMKKMVSMSEEAQASAFLNFAGDFDGTCTDEATKFNLNTLATLNPEQTAQEGLLNPYFQYRQGIIEFVKQPQYTVLFELADVKPDEVIRNIADWVDGNDQIDLGPGRSGGVEMSLYEHANAPYRVKNGGLTTLDEAFQIAGVVDDWFGELKNHFTIYGDGKVNICAASNDVTAAIIRRYIASLPNPPPLRLDDTEVMQRLVAAVAFGCQMAPGGDQQVQAVSQSLETALVPGPEEMEGGAGVGGARPARGFDQMITGTSRYFSLNLTGQVEGETVRMLAVVDTQDADPNHWPVLYWKVY